MKTIELYFLSIFVSLHVLGYSAVFPKKTWISKSPADLGLVTAKINEFASKVGGVGCIVKDGYMVKTWGTQSSKGDWASAHKPVMSTLLLFAVHEGKISSVDALIFI